MDSEYGTGTNVKNSQPNTKANGNKGDVQNPLTDSEDERGNSRHPRIYQGITESEGIVAPAKRLKSLSSGSSSSTSSEDFIQVDPKLINPRASATAAASSNHVRPLPIYYKTDLSSDSSTKSECDCELSTGGTSQVSVITHESLSHSPSVTESPPIQVMEKPSGFDPHRIPHSVFISKSSSPVDWSVASNESLFSIHIGNNSFSRDHVLKLSGELHKSGELGKSRNSYKSNKLISFSPPLLAVQWKESDGRKFNLGRDSEETEKAVVQTPVGIVGDESKENYPGQELSFNHHSDGSETRIQTIAFPQKKKHERSLLSCSNCSCGFCCSTWQCCCLCKWPSCNCCTWPSCNCCKWPSCRCCKLPSCGSCCKWPSCSSCKWPSCSCCKLPSCSCSSWLSCRGCSQPSCSCCKWLSCSCGKWSSCSGCCQPSCSYCKWPSCSCCKWPSCSCKWPSCNCCKWPSCSCSACPSFSSCSWAFCCCWNSRRKRTNATKGRHAQMKSSRRWYSYFSCCSNPC